MRQNCKKRLSILLNLLKDQYSSLLGKSKAPLDRPAPEKPRRQTGIMTTDGRRVWIMNIPYQIEADCGDDLAHRLAGFPLNIMYTGFRRSRLGGRLEACCYWFDPGSYLEDDKKREMNYRPRFKSPFWIKVEYDKTRKFWQTLKYRHEDLLVMAEGTGFYAAMKHTTLPGLEPDELTDDWAGEHGLI